jgi:ATP-dependent RNA helicase DDX54/DBP10
MPHRAVSPAASENEYDISTALFGGATGSDDETDLHIPLPGTNGAIDVLDDGFATEGEDDEAFIARKQATANRKGVTSQGKKAKGGSFQAMGLDGKLLKAIARKGFSVPTPIQRKAIPMILDGQDVVASARTGSGKTAAFVIPMIQQLKAHKTQVGARALILSPSRELALQTVKVANELGKGTDLRSMLVVGGDSMEDQFKAMTSNPDIIIATPGRFLHLQIEMGLDLSSFKYVVFDEADRLFEMGFAAQLSEILHGLPTTRQTLLFSATLPKSLVEFVRAGLSEPKLVRLDAETKVSSELENAFFYVKSADKEGALLHVLNDIIQMPAGPTDATRKAQSRNETKTGNSKKRKRGDASQPSEHVADNATIVFVATKHHVEYIAALLRASGFPVSYLYSSLDQTARKINISQFRSGQTAILVVTDIAARGVDIPVLANVINYDFASSAKLWVHRVGRTARAGRRGWSYNLVTSRDLPYMLDLQLFLSKRLILGRSETPASSPSFAEDMIVGTLRRSKLEDSIETINKLLSDSDDTAALRTVASKGEKLYNRTRSAASSESVKRSKDIITSTTGINELNLLFSQADGQGDNDSSNAGGLGTADREDLLARIRGFRPEETVFEIGKRGGKAGGGTSAGPSAGDGESVADLVRKARERMEPRRFKHHAARQERKASAAESGRAPTDPSASVTGAAKGIDGEQKEAGRSASSSSLRARSSDTSSSPRIPASHVDGELNLQATLEDGASAGDGSRGEMSDDAGSDGVATGQGRGKGPGPAEAGSAAGIQTTNLQAPLDVDMDSASEAELEVTFSSGSGSRHPSRKGNAWEDDEHFMSYTPRATNLAEDRALSVHGGSGAAADFLQQARGATLDMGGDESKGFAEASRAKGGSGMRWDRKAKKYVARANDLDGSKEGKAKYIRGESGQKIAATFRSGRFEAWKKRERMDRMPRVGEREAAGASANAPGKRWKHKQERAPKEADKWRDDYAVRKKRVAEAREKRVGRFKEGSGKSELKGSEDIAKDRKLKERRREKNARPQRKGRK